MTIYVGGCGGCGGSSTSLDRFAPKYLVGNTAYSLPDTASVAGLAAGFQYFADPGDGSGIRAACAAAAANPGDIWVRPGDYQIPSGSGPITIPGVTLRGSGSSTRVLGAPDGDQGVFIVQTNLAGAGLAKLEEIVVIVNAPTGPTAGSIAAVFTQDGVSLRDVNVLVTMDQTSTITRGILMQSLLSPFPSSDVLDVTVVVNSSVNNDTAIEIGGGQNPNGTTALARNLQVFGNPTMTRGVLVDSATLIATQVAVFNFTGQGVEFTNTSGNGQGRIQIDQGFIQSDVANATTVGVVLDGIGHTLRSVEIETSAGVGAAGIRLLRSPNGSVAQESRDIKISGCTVSGGWEYGIEVGSLTAFGGIGAGAIGCSISDTRINAASYGITFTGQTVTNNHVLDNDVNLFYSRRFAPIVVGILFDENANNVGAVNNFIRGNHVNLQCDPAGQPTTHCILLRSQRSVCSDNILNLTHGGYNIALLSGSERVVVQGNVCSASGPPPLQLGADSLGCIFIDSGTPNTRGIVTGNSCTANYQVPPLTSTAIVIDSRATVVNNNAVLVIAPAGVPGIRLEVASASCNVIGNICDGSGGVAVTDLGFGNNLAQNVGI